MQNSSVANWALRPSRAWRYLKAAGPTITIAAASGCGPPPAPPLLNPDSAVARVQSIVGCWRFDGTTRRAPFLADTVLVRFDTTRADRGDAHLTLHVGVQPAYLSRIAYWGLPEDPAAVFALWGDGHTGVDLRLRVTGDSMVGKAYRLTDFMPLPRSGAAVAATRADCSAKVGSPSDSMSNRERM